MADATIPQTATQGLFALGPATLLRDALLWQLQTNFYEHLSVRAWSDAIVPNFVTSNAFIAQCYARVILNFVKDWFERPEADATEPIHIIEIGAGHGRLSFLVLRELVEMREQWPPMRASSSAAAPRAPFKWVITDFAESNVRFWLAHSHLKPFFEAGLCDAAVFDAERSSGMTLLHSGRELAPGALANPAVAVCNYIFDTLRQDAFRFVEGQLQEALVTLYSDREEPDPTHPDVIKRLRAAWDYRPTTPEAAYPASSSVPGGAAADAAALQTMLRVYAGRTRNASVLVPVGGIAAMSRVAALARGARLMILCGDKAYNHEEELQGLRDPHLAVHGSFSFMVNFHAVRLYALARGGFSLHTPQLDGFKVSAFVIGCTPPSQGAGAAAATAASAAAPPPPPPPPLLSADEVGALCDVTVSTAALAFPSFLCAWADAMDTFGPDNFSTLQRCVRDEVAAPSLRTALAVLRASGWDSDVFFKFKQTLIERAPACSEKQAADVYCDVARVAERYYPLQASKDIAFELGRVCMGLKRYTEGVALFEASRATCGDHHVTWYNIGICDWYLERHAAAHAAFSASVALRPDYADAANWRTRVEAKLQGDEFLRAHAARGAHAAGAAEGGDGTGAAAAAAAGSGSAAGAQSEVPAPSPPAPADPAPPVAAS